MYIIKVFWRGGRVVECGGLESRFPATAGTGVQIPPSPPLYTALRVAS